MPCTCPAASTTSPASGDGPIRQVRSIGQVAFLVTANELLLAAFPNFLEPLFLVTASILAYERVVRRPSDWRARAFAVLDRHRWLIGALIVIYKLQDEYVTHVGNIDRSDLLRQILGGQG